MSLRTFRDDDCVREMRVCVVFFEPPLVFVMLDIFGVSFGAITVIFLIFDAQFGVFEKESTKKEANVPMTSFDRFCSFFVFVLFVDFVLCCELSFLKFSPLNLSFFVDFCQFFYFPPTIWPFLPICLCCELSFLKYFSGVDVLKDDFCDQHLYYVVCVGFVCFCCFCWLMVDDTDDRHYFDCIVYHILISSNMIILNYSQLL